MSNPNSHYRRVAWAGLIALILLVVLIGWFAAKRQGPNDLLTGRWLLFFNDDPNPKRYLDFSPSGSVTCYKLDGVTLDQLPGHTEIWSVKGNIIETVGHNAASAKPLSTWGEFVSRVLSSEGDQPRVPTRFVYTVLDDATLQLDLLDSQLQHRIILQRAEPEK
jgi:hypothetical protein